MLSVLEPATIDANIDELVLHVGVDPTVSSRRSAYFEALNRIQPLLERAKRAPALTKATAPGLTEVMLENDEFETATCH